MQIVSVGIDLGKTTFHLVALGAAGKVLVRKKFTQRQLLTYTANLQTSLIGMEACSGAHFLGRALRKQGHDVRLIAAQFVKAFGERYANHISGGGAWGSTIVKGNLLDLRFCRSDTDKCTRCPFSSKWGLKAYSGCDKSKSNEGVCACKQSCHETEDYTASMKRIASVLTFTVGLFSAAAFAQTSPEKAIETTVCDIANDPMQFEGKLVQVRAQIWPDVNNKDGNVMDRNWMFGYTYASRDKVHVCHFLPAKFTKPNDLWGQTYFATFFGKVVSNNEAIDLSRHWSPASKRSNVILLIESQSDIQGVKDYLNGPIMLLRLYDQQSGSFVTPE